MKKIFRDNIKKITGAAVIILIAAAAYLYSETLRDDKADYTFAAQASDEAQAEEESPEPTPAVWKAHIAGEVKNPGVYDINEETRLQDLIELAGGLSDKADMSAVNLALKVADQQKISIPAINEQVSSSPAPSAGIVENPASPAASVNINSAGLAELMTLPGVGEVTAQKIIDYRDANGVFESVDDLLFVDGIGEVTLDGMRDMVIAP